MSDLKDDGMNVSELIAKAKDLRNTMATNELLKGFVDKLDSCIETVGTIKGTPKNNYRACQLLHYTVDVSARVLKVLADVDA